MGKLGDAIRKKYRTPREALKALGLDESLLDVSRLALDGAKKMPTRLEYIAVTKAADALNPLLAMDAKVEYGPIFKGLTTKNLKQRKTKIIGDIKTALKGKTIAQDAPVEHLAHLLNALEHTNEPKSLDESVNKAQHNAMEAAAHGHSNLGIPKNVGEEFSRADKGKSFDWDMIRDMLGGGMTKDNWEDFKKKSEDEMPENALDGEEETNIEVEEGEDGEIEEEEAEDKIEEEEGEDEIEEEEGEDRKARDKKARDRKARDAKGAKDRHARDKHAKDKHAMDKKFMTMDEVNKLVEKSVQSAVATVRKSGQEVAEARERVRPYVGELSMALDSASKVYRAAAQAMDIEDAETLPEQALWPVIKACARTKSSSQDDAPLAADSAGDGDSSEFFKMFPEAKRIGIVG